MARTVTGGMGKQRASVLGGRYSAQNNPSPSAAGPMQGTPGGLTMGPLNVPSGRGPGLKFRIGDEGYIWILVLIEVFVMGVLRRWSRAHHGG